jgi:hypothetical protein
MGETVDDSVLSPGRARPTTPIASRASSLMDLKGAGQTPNQ